MMIPEAGCALLRIIMVCKVQEGMVADLPQVVQDAQGFGSVEVGVEELPGLGEIFLVDLKLGRRQAAEDDEFIPLWQLTLMAQLLFCSSQNVTLDQVPQLIKALL